MILSKNLKKVLVSAAALLMFASVGASASTTSVSARHVRTHRTARVHHHRKNMHRYNLRKYRHRRNAHFINLRRISHKRNAHKLNARRHIRRHRASHKTSLLDENENTENRVYYKTGSKDGLNFANDWLGTAKPGDVDMIHHLAGNQYYHKGWINAEYPYAGSHSVAEATYRALNNPNVGLYQSSTQYMRN